MQNISYWKSKRHVTIFVISAALSFASVAFFIASMIASFASKAPTLQEDPVVSALLFLFVLFVLLDALFFVVFLVDLILFFVQRKRIRNAKQSNVEVELKDSPITLKNKDEKVTTVIGDNVIADIKVGEGSAQEYELDTKEEFKPSYKHCLMIQSYGSWPALAVGIPLIIVLLIGLNLLLNLNDVVRGFIYSAICAGAVIAVFALLFFLIPILMVKRQKTLKPVDSGIRIYGDNIEYYMEIDQEIKGQRLNAVLKTKFNFSLAKHLETKNYFLMKQKVNNQTAVLIIEKKTADERLLPAVKDKFNQYKKAN